METKSEYTVAIAVTPSPRPWLCEKCGQPLGYIERDERGAAYLRTTFDVAAVMSTEAHGWYTRYNCRCGHGQEWHADDAALHGFWASLAERRRGE